MPILYNLFSFQMKGWSTCFTYSVAWRKAGMASRSSNLHQDVEEAFLGNSRGGDHGTVLLLESSFPDKQFKSIILEQKRISLELY
jgi:hypothetical protein